MYVTALLVKYSTMIVFPDAETDHSHAVTFSCPCCLHVEGDSKTQVTGHSWCQLFQKVVQWHVQALVDHQQSLQIILHLLLSLTTKRSWKSNSNWWSYWHQCSSLFWFWLMLALAKDTIVFCFTVYWLTSSLECMLVPCLITRGLCIFHLFHGCFHWSLWYAVDLLKCYIITSTSRLLAGYCVSWFVSR